MMALTTWLLFVPACFAINMAPGPNNLLSVSNAARFGLAQTLLGGLGRLLAFAVMIIVTALGLGAVLTASELAFHIIKWGGAAYLLYLGIKIWRAPVDAVHFTAPATSALALMRQEFLIAADNPKAILTFTAFFPQFIDRNANALPQFAVMGSTFLLLEVVSISIYAMGGRQIAAIMRTARGMQLINRISGGALCGAGALLATTQR